MAIWRSKAADILVRLANKLSNYRPEDRVWIDVGAHLGETTFNHALRDSSLTVYAFEPDLELASARMGILRNFVVLPFAISEENGMATFYKSNNSMCSSLLPFDKHGMEQWRTTTGPIFTVSQMQVPTMRLDKFISTLGIDQVDFLKVDAQGSDLSVVKSLGQEIKKVRKIMLETVIAPYHQYQRQPSKEDLISYLTDNGFILVDTTEQSVGQEQNLTFAQVD